MRETSPHAQYKALIGRLINNEIQAAATAHATPKKLRIWATMALLSVACASFMPTSGSVGGPWRICRSHQPYGTQPRHTVRASLMDEDGLDDSSLAMPKNRYVDTILNITAPDLIKGFADTAPAEVQQAVRATVVSLLGNLPPDMYDVSVASTGKNVASLMYSMQMTGYMFRSAEYRRSLMESLSVGEGMGLLPPVDDGNAEIRDLPQVSGTIKVKLSEDSEAEVEASAYMAELRNEVQQLRGELLTAKKTSSEAQGGGLLAYVQSIGRDKIGDLTASVSDVRPAPHPAAPPLLLPPPLTITEPRVCICAIHRHRRCLSRCGC